ncbi:hypothetical protein [Fervidobacterium thailandense]|uniref:Uncharacterized protein n=1 Tax=Fervidobacterium thailandense TaxID=1008305 RepID=A0A1E3G434_9BACT|nr:hypothetical protein [Fervidobacterium thailandense]ODN30942.1 hypothetical protein A4H02_03570 [Fervidobacterium thailandense]
MEIAIWALVPITVMVDNVFRDYFSLSPLYFLFESVSNAKIATKVTRLSIFAILFQAYALREIDFLWLLLTLGLIFFELYRDYFYYPWIASLFQIAIFLPRFYIDKPLSLLYGLIVDAALFYYSYRKIFESE